ncbi:MAG: type II 3-dehydroquinate dehydratase [Atribacterota bacterium]
MVKIGVINGPNLNQLGKRKEEHYGTITLAEINNRLEKYALEIGIKLEFIQSNYEGKIIDSIQSFSNEVNGIIINPGAFTHYSYAIRDALEDCPIPVIEVHLSNIFSREDFREKSVTVPVCDGQIVGMGYYGYLMAIKGLQYLIKVKNSINTNKEVSDE